MAAGLVLTASAKPGALLKPDSTVDLMVSKGPEPIRIRNYAGKSAEKAQRALEKAGFAVKVSTAQLRQDRRGRVISQNPEKGTARRATRSP